MTIDPKKVANARRVAEFRDRKRQQGGALTTVTLDKSSIAAIATICYHTMCSKQGAIQTAIKRYAAELLRKKP